MKKIKTNQWTMWQDNSELKINDSNIQKWQTHIYNLHIIADSDCGISIHGPTQNCEIRRR